MTCFALLLALLFSQSRRQMELRGWTLNPILARARLKEGQKQWSENMLGTAVVVFKGTSSPQSRAGNVRTRKLAGLGKKIREAPAVVRRGGGH